nr:immunoglobulin light chain junction region [Macaca mulatta]MOX78705.1 immunoglobulin light chain junction region [Macaca mulatta]MOX79113.1 immunoglobulin light chain junction region [Macaca mulatta]MOX81070.1 immunoglobulin light chain junction region [Macaca mulatta]
DYYCQSYDVSLSAYLF